MDRLSDLGMSLDKKFIVVFYKGQVAEFDYYCGCYDNCTCPRTKDAIFGFYSGSNEDNIKRVMHYIENEIRRDPYRTKMLADFEIKIVCLKDVTNEQ